MTSTVAFNRLILRAVLRNVSVRDALNLPDFDEVFRTILGWDGLEFIFRVHGQEFNRFRQATRATTLREFPLRPRETFLSTCGAIDLWEGEFPLLNQEPGIEGDQARLCLGGRGAAPPEHGGGPTGYSLIRKRPKPGEAMCTPVPREAVIGRLSTANPDNPASTWDLLRSAGKDGLPSIDRRRQAYGP